MRDYGLGAGNWSLINKQTSNKSFQKVKLEDMNTFHNKSSLFISNTPKFQIQALNTLISVNQFNN